MTNIPPVTTNVDTALRQLSMSSRDIYFDDKVTKADSNLNAFFGRVKYFFFYWNPVAAIYNWSKLTSEDASIALFKEKTADLVKAVNERGLTPDEANARGIYGVQYTDTASQSKQAEAVSNAKIAVKAFYNAFKERCVMLGVDASKGNYADFVKAATVAVDNKAESSNAPRHFGMKREETQSLFLKRMLKDSVETVTAQNLADVTEESINKLCADLHKVVVNKSVPSLKAMFIDALKAKHSATAAAFADEFTNIANPAYAGRLATVKTKLEADLNTKIAALEAIYKPLADGSNANSVHAAWVEMDAAQTALNQAIATFDAEYQNIWGVPFATPAARAGLDFANQPTLLAAQNTLKAAIAKLDQTTKTYDDRFAELNRVATWAHGSQFVTGGEIHQFYVERNNLDHTAANKVATLGAFYATLV